MSVQSSSTSTSSAPKTRKPRTAKPADAKSTGIKVAALLSKLPVDERERALHLAKTLGEFDATSHVPAVTA